MPTSGNSLTVYDSRHEANLHTRVGARNKRWGLCGGRDASLRQNNAPLLDMPFLRCTEYRSYIDRASKILARYVNVLSNKLRAVGLEFVVLHKHFDRMHLYIHFD